MGDGNTGGRTIGRIARKKICVIQITMTLVNLCNRKYIELDLMQFQIARTTASSQAERARERMQI